MHVRALPELPGARMARGEGPHRAAKLRTPPDAQRGAGRWGSEGACLPAGPSRNPRARSPGRPMMCQTAPSGVPAQLLDHLVRWRRVATPGAAVRGSSGRRGGYARRLSRRGTEIGARETVGREVGKGSSRGHRPSAADRCAPSGCMYDGCSVWPRSSPKSCNQETRQPLRQQTPRTPSEVFRSYPSPLELGLLRWPAHWPTH